VDIGGGPAAAGVGGEVVLGVRRQEDHRRRGVGGDDLAGGLDAVDPGQVDVHQHEPGMVLVGQLEGLLAGLGLGDDGEPGRQADNRARDGAEWCLIVDDQHWHFAVSRVGVVLGHPGSIVARPGHRLPGCHPAGLRWC
jgi:hypothetical protein